MSTTATRTRRTVVAGLAGLTLTAGLSLGGAGVADAAPIVTCIDNFHGTATLTVPGRAPEKRPVSAGRQCSSSDNEEGGGYLQLENFTWNGPYTTAANALSFGLPSADGSMAVRLHGYITSGYQHPSVGNSVGFRVGPTGHSVIHIVTQDAYGVRLDTEATFDQSHR